MSEWFKEHAWKACNGATRSEVRILSLPPEAEHKNNPRRGYFYIPFGKAKGRILLSYVVKEEKQAFLRFSSLEANPLELGLFFGAERRISLFSVFVEKD